MTTRKSIVAGLVLGALLLTGGLVLLGDGRTSGADDAVHTTSFSIASKDYGLGVGPEQALITLIDSSDSQDKQAKVSIAAMLPGTYVYTKMCGTTAYRSDTDGLYAVATQPMNGYASGTVVQATFTTFDTVGATAFTFTRTVTIP